MTATQQFLSACLIFSFFFCSVYSAIFGSFSINPNQNDLIANNNQLNDIYSLTYFTSQKKQDNILIRQFQNFGDNSNSRILESSVNFLGITQNPNNFTDLTIVSEDINKISGNVILSSSQRDNSMKFEVIQIIKNQQIRVSQDYSYQENNSLVLALKESHISQNISHDQQNLTELDKDQRNQNQTQSEKDKILAFNYQNYSPYYHIFSIPHYQSPRAISRSNPYRQFSDVGFYHSLPREFVDGEVFRFSGIVTNQELLTQNKQLKIYIIFSGKNITYKNVCVSPILKSTQFNISCHIKKPGIYSMAVMVGKTITTSPILRTVISSQNFFKQTAYENQDPQPLGLRIELTNNSLYFIWDSNASLTNLTIYQTNNEIMVKREYLLSNYHSQFKIPFKDFQDFSQDITYAQISHAKSMNGSLNIIYTKFTNKINKISFNAVNHAFDTINQNLLMEPELPWRVNIGEKFKLNITFNEQTKNIIYITKPDRNLQKILYINALSNSSSMGSGSQLSLQFSFSKPGTHIIEINNMAGIAVLNRPVYVGLGYPLIPDYKDMATESEILNNNFAVQKIYESYYQRTNEKLKIKQPSKNSTLQLKREYLLTLINGLRKKYNVREIQIDQTLNKIAQNHSEDMIKRVFFGHTNPDGQKVQERARKLNFTLLVGQNVARSNFLIENHLNLQRSASHLQNTINKIWTRVGVGITMNKNNQYFVTYVFSTRDLLKFPLLESQYIRFQEQLVNLIISKNSKKRKINENEMLSSDIKEWVESDRSVSLIKFLETKKNYGKKNGFSFKVVYTDDWVEKLRDGNLLEFNSIKKQFGVGLGLKKQAGGYLEAFIVFL